jgi:hypothetical protein
LAKSHVDVAVDLLETPPQLLDAVYGVLDPPRQLAYLRFEPIHTQFGINGRSGTRGHNRSGTAAIDLPLQHAEVPFQAVQAVLNRPVLGLCRRDRSSDRDEHQQQSWAGIRQDRTPSHPGASRSRK